MMVFIVERMIRIEIRFFAYSLVNERHKINVS